jgi:hypothetical protein
VQFGNEIILTKYRIVKFVSGGDDGDGYKKSNDCDLLIHGCASLLPLKSDHPSAVYIAVP